MVLTASQGQERRREAGSEGSRRLRQLIWKRWKRGKTRWRELVKLGVPPKMAGLGAMGKSPWHMAASPVVNMTLSNVYFRRQGLANLAERYQQLRRT